MTRGEEDDRENKQEKRRINSTIGSAKSNDDKKEKGYLFVVLKKYGGRIAQNSIIITLLLLFIDEKNYPSQLKNYIGDKLFWISCALIFLLLLSYLYHKGFMDLRKMKAVCEIELFSIFCLNSNNKLNTLAK